MNSCFIELYRESTALALALALLLGPLPAVAADDIDEVQITATRRPESALRVPVPTTLLGPEALRLLAPQTVMDALHGEPGTFVQQTTPGQGVVIVRGLKGSEVLHLVDGFRLNNAIFRNAPNQYIALVDSQNLDRIEVVRGPMSSLYGSDAMGGVVQMLTHEPRFSGDDMQREGRLRSIYGSADRSLLSRAEGALGNERFSLSGGLTYQDTEELRIGGGERTPFTAFRSSGGDLKFLGQLAEGHELMLSGQLMRQPNTPRADVTNPSFSSATPENLLSQFRPQQRSFYHARYRMSQATAAYDQLELHFGRQRIEDGSRAQEINGGNLRETRERSVDTSVGWSVQAGKAAGESHYFTYGGEFYRDRVHSERMRRDTPPGQRPAGFGPLDPRFPDGAVMQQLAVFASHDWKLAPRLDLNYGLRYSLVKMAIGGGFEAKKNRDVSGNLGLSFALRDDLYLTANVGRGFRAPNVFDVGTFGNRPNNRFNIRNPELEPETVWAFDVGVKHSGERLQASLNLFHSRYDDKIVTIRTGQLREEREITQSVNASDVNFWGLEAGARWQFTDSLALFGTATYTRGHERLGSEIPGDTSHPAERIPPLFGKFGVQWNWRDRLALETYMYYADGQHRLSSSDLEDGRINPNGTPGWSTLNARVSWTVNERASFSLRLENLLDRRYREHASGLNEPGINALLSLDYRL
jgi:TonB-dependent heme/hemoglobin receptor